MALPIFDGAPPGGIGGHGTQPMAAVSLEQIQAAAGTGTVPIPNAISEQLAASRAQGGFGPVAAGPIVGGMAAPGDLSALEAPPPAASAPLAPAPDQAAALAPAESKSGKAGLIIAAIIALLIAAAVTFAILRSRAG
jgi:hypothetical protein